MSASIEFPIRMLEFDVTFQSTASGKFSSTKGAQGHPSWDDFFLLNFDDVIIVRQCGCVCVFEIFTVSFLFNCLVSIILALKIS